MSVDKSVWLVRFGTLCAALAVLSVAPKLSRAQPGESKPDKIVRGFYSWYLHELNHDNSNPLKQKTTALKYLTPQLYANAPRLTRRMDADIFICAQDWDAAWERNFTVATPTVIGTSATTLVTLPSGGDKIRIKVALKKMSSGWRIDRVTCAPTKVNR